MTITKTLLISAVVSRMRTQIAELVKAKRLATDKVEIAEARVVDLEEWLEAKDDEYFPENAAGNTKAFEIFERKAITDFTTR